MRHFKELNITYDVVPTKNKHPSITRWFKNHLPCGPKPAEEPFSINAEPELSQQSSVT